MTPLQESRDLLTNTPDPATPEIVHDERKHPAAVPPLVGVQGVDGHGLSKQTGHLEP